MHERISLSLCSFSLPTNLHLWPLTDMLRDIMGGFVEACQGPISVHMLNEGIIAGAVFKPSYWVILPLQRFWYVQLDAFLQNSPHWNTSLWLLPHQPDNQDINHCLSCNVGSRICWRVIFGLHRKHWRAFCVLYIRHSLDLSSHSQSLRLGLTRNSVLQLLVYRNLSGCT